VKGIAGVIEASKKQRKKVEGEDAAEEEEGTNAQWLIDALPKTGKRQKQQMKKFGVEARRGAGAGTGGEGTGKGGKDEKISSKSSWQRRKEERKRGAIEGSQRRKRKMQESENEDEEEWEGFDD
jgi:ATP-dependent RNA helicase DDX52/ROK1